MSLEEGVRCFERGLLEGCLGVGLGRQDPWRGGGNDDRICNGWRGGGRTKGGREMEGAGAVAHERGKPLRTARVAMLFPNHPLSEAPEG